MYDVFIVGAGPVGCYFVRKIKEMNYKLVEEHGEVGKPVQCAGLVGEKIFNYVEKDYLNVINGAYIHYHDDVFSLRKHRVAYVLDRAQFDKQLSEGLDISFKERFLSARRKGDTIEIKTTKGVYYAKYLVGCDGASSRVRPYVSQERPRYLKSFQYTIDHDHDEHMVSFFLSPFSWVIPETEGRCRVGVLSDYPARDLPPFDGRARKKTGGLIPVGYMHTYHENVFLLGDAACQTKPLTGGGLYYGIQAADIAGNLFLEGKIARYDNAWKQEFGRQIQFGILGRMIYEDITERDMNTFYTFLQKKKEMIESSCEFDRHSTLLKVLFSSPEIWFLFMKYLAKERRELLRFFLL